MRYEFAAEALRRHGVDFPGFLGLVADGELPVIGLDRSAVGLKRLRFAEAAMQRCGDEADGDASLTLQQTAEWLRLKWEVVAHLARRGLLASDGGEVSRPALEAFRRDFVSGAELARISGTSPRALAARLELAGDRPATGPGVDGSRQNFYRRPDVQAWSPPP